MVSSLPDTFIGLLERAVAATPDRDVLVFPNERLTYSELYSRVALAQRALLSLGVARGDNVGVLMQNCPDHLALMFAISSLGAVDVPINTRNRPAELAHVIADAGLKLVFTNTLGAELSNLPERLDEGVRLAAEGVGSVEPPRVILLESGPGRGLVSSSEIAALAERSTAQDVKQQRDLLAGDDILIMLYTSGTTANPKGCPILNRQLVSISAQVGDRFGTRDGDKIWDALPFFHASSLLPFTACLVVRGTFISATVFEPGETIGMIDREKATMAWPAFGTVWQELLTHESFSPEKVSTLRAVMAVAPPETIRVLQSATPDVPLMSCYGITEGLGVPIMVRFDDDQKTRSESSGLPFEGIEVEVRDPETHERMPWGERGALWLRGPNVFGGYWNDAEATAKAFDDDGWFFTGDIANQQENGLVNYFGRLKDMLKVGGENVAAVEIEAYLSTHPAVKLAAVVAAPDPKYGEVPAAFIELRPGAKATESEIIDFCTDRIAGFKVPRYVRFVTEWPMSATKIRKVDLQRDFALELTSR